MEVISFAQSNCKNCYKCIRECPVKAIRMKDDKAQIVEDRCITCGTCLTVCPQNAKTVKRDIKKIKTLLSQNREVVVSLAPSFAGALSFEHYSQVVSALKKLGFWQVYQTSVGARLIAKRYVELYDDKSKSTLITTACPSVNYLVQKYYPKLIDRLIPVVSPLEAHARYLKEVKGHPAVVFIGPCLAKKVEIRDGDYSAVDAALTFEELQDWWQQEGIDPLREPIEGIDDIFSDDANLYPIPGGSFKTIEPHIENKWRHLIEVDGLDNCIELLEELQKEEIEDAWIEMNACTGSCSNGPAIGKVNKGPLRRIEDIKDFAKECGKIPGSQDLQGLVDFSLNLEKEYPPMEPIIRIPSDEELSHILRQIGKYRPEHELNCGACGYNSCRDKAVAVYNGMAETYMCIPYMRSRAKSLSNLIIESTPNAIIAVDQEMKIQEFNQSAEEMFKVSLKDVHGKSLAQLFDPQDFLQVHRTRENVIDKKVILEEYGLTTLQNIYYLREHRLTIGIIADITASECERRKNDELRQKTIETTQKVIEKQMRVAQEIASVLGETTAETKVMLSKIKDLLAGEKAGD